MIYTYTLRFSQLSLSRKAILFDSYPRFLIILLSSIGLGQYMVLPTTPHDFALGLFFFSSLSKTMLIFTLLHFETVHKELGSEAKEVGVLYDLDLFGKVLFAVLLPGLRLAICLYHSGTDRLNLGGARNRLDTILYRCPL